MIFAGPGFYDPFWSFGYGLGYGYPYYDYPYYGGGFPYYGPPAVARERGEPDYLPPLDGAGPAQGQYWYHCDSPEGYYPYVESCDHEWQPVPVTPPGGPNQRGDGAGPGPRNLSPPR